jgi:hypothetical protein
MTKLEIDLFAAPRGSVTAPAGCGKTQLIADAIASSECSKPVLVLTHTNAGKGVLDARLARAGAPKRLFRVATLDSWCIRLISRFPLRSGHAPDILSLSNPRHDYPAIRGAAYGLLRSSNLDDPIASTYSRAIVDEYQDCTITQHSIVDALAEVLPTSVLGDPLQSIFGFAERTVDWDGDVLARFPSLGVLSTPWRWKNAGCEALGQWLLEARRTLLSGQPLDLRGAPPEVTWIALPSDRTLAQLARIGAAQTRPPADSGSVLIVGDSTSPASQQLVASQTPGAVTVEAVELRDLIHFGRQFDLSDGDALAALLRFASSLMTNVEQSTLNARVRSLRAGTAKKGPSSVEEAALAFVEAPSYARAVRLLLEIREAAGVRLYRPEVFHVLLDGMRQAESGECSFAEAVTRARERNRQAGRVPSRRAVGSTLLLKGLEADVVVILNPAVMDARNLYVALSRGARRVVVCSESPVLQPCAG